MKPQLCDAIERIVRETDLKILLCPEDQAQMEVSRKMILKKLPAVARTVIEGRQLATMAQLRIEIGAICSNL